LAAAVLERSAARGWNLAEDPGRLRIQTIDSFNFRLASQLPVAGQAGGALIVSDRPQVQYQRAARQTLLTAERDPELATDVELLFERLDNQWRNVERLLAGMLELRGHWLRYVLEHEADALCERIRRSLDNIVQDHLQSAVALLSSSLCGVEQAVSGLGHLGSRSECLPAWQRLAGLTLTTKGDWRKPSGIGRAMDPITRETLRTAVENLSRTGGARELLFELLRLPAAVLRRDDAGAIRALSRILRLAAAQLQAQFATDGRTDHTYVAGAARAALSDAGLPTDLALRTGLALRHILVDEFQDTSLAQFDLIEALTVGWEEGDGRTLFVVGDPMQSIYQFREAEVGLFLRARDHGIGNVQLTPLRLTRNFRSTPALVRWANATFSTLFPGSDDVRASAVSFTPSVAGSSAHDPVEETANAASREVIQLRLFAHLDRGAEAAAIAEQISALRRQSLDSSIAVLVASRAHAAPIMACLEEREIAAIGIDLVPLRDLSIVRDLIALTCALYHLGDRTAWLAVLRAPWCGVSLATLTQLSQRGDPQLIWEALCDDSRLASCTPADRARLERLRGVLDVALATRGSAPPAEWLETTWLRLGAADAYPQAQLRHARAFLAVLGDRAAAGEWSGPAEFEGRLAELFAQPRALDSNPVQIMTIHRAKGLEFDHVFVPSLDRSLGASRDPLLRWVDLPRLQGESDLIMAPVPAVGEDSKSGVGAYLKRLMARRAANEQTRLLYVAITRSKRSLYLSAAPKGKADGTVVPRAGTLLAQLWPALESEFQAYESAAAADIELPHLQPIRRLVDGWEPPRLDALASDAERLPVGRQSLVLEFSWVHETARHIGTVVHAALERFAKAAELPPRTLIEAARDDYRQQLRRRGVQESELQHATTQVVDALTRTIGDGLGRWILSAEHREAHSELALTGIAGGRLRSVVIDRSFVDREGSRWVIDFKTSPHEGGGLEEFLDQQIERYRPQLQAYVALARALGPQPVRAALYFPLLAAFRELR
jgi:ATP-dependent exoDNAse (exonuclease V) beta subunit